MASSWNSLEIATLAVNALTPRGNRRNIPWWEDGMTRLFSADGVASLDDIQAAYDQLTERFRAELYVTQQARPLLATQP